MQAHHTDGSSLQKTLASRCRNTPVHADLQAALDASNAVVAEKRARLEALRSEVAALQKQLADTQAELASLTFQVRGAMQQAGL